jgi:hypothetical protein
MCHYFSRGSRVYSHAVIVSVIHEYHANYILASCDPQIMLYMQKKLFVYSCSSSKKEEHLKIIFKNEQAMIL